MFWVSTERSLPSQSTKRTKMEEVKTELDVIKALLASHTEFPSKTPQERFADLKDEHPKKPLLTFLKFSESELKEQLNKLEDRLTELQKEKNLILTQGKGGGKS